MTVNEVKLFVEYISNKDQSGDSLSPDEFNQLLKTASIDFARYVYGATELYRPGSPTPPVAYEVTQYVTDALSVLKVKMSGAGSMVVNSSGVASLPSDYAHVSSIRYLYSKPGACETDAPIVKEVPVEVVKDDKLGVVLDSAVKAPTKKYPIAVFYNDTIQFYPVDLKKVIFTYLKIPATPFRAYTLVNDVDVYNSAGSTQLEYPEITHMEICRIILGYMGINLRDNELQSYNERFKQTGK